MGASACSIDYPTTYDYHTNTYPSVIFGFFATHHCGPFIQLTFNVQSNASTLPFSAIHGGFNDEYLGISKVLPKRLVRFCLYKISINFNDDTVSAGHGNNHNNNNTKLDFPNSYIVHVQGVIYCSFASAL